MIQDIFPNRLDNQYVECSPQDNDVIFFFEGSSLLAKYIKEDKYILVPYHTINGNGLLKCIKPDIIFIDGIGYKGNVLIGFSDSFNFGDGVDVILHKDIMKG